jgi:plastocyanin
MKLTLHRSAAFLGGLALLAVTAASAGAQAAPSTQSVGINNFAFSPAEVTVPVGSSVTWTNQQNVRHTTTADSGVWDSDILASNASFSFTFQTPGDFTYHCDIHPDMLGVVHVVAAPAAAPDAAAGASAVEATQASSAPAVAPVAVAPTPTPQSDGYGY